MYSYNLLLTLLSYQHVASCLWLRCCKIFLCLFKCHIITVSNSLKQTYSRKLWELKQKNGQNFAKFNFVSGEVFCFVHERNKWPRTFQKSFKRIKSSNENERQLESSHFLAQQTSVGGSCWKRRRRRNILQC